MEDFQKENLAMKYYHYLEEKDLLDIDLHLYQYRPVVQQLLHLLVLLNQIPNV